MELKAIAWLTGILFFLIVTVIVQPIFTFIHCAKNKKLTDRSKNIWLLAFALFWSFATIIYGLIVNKSHPLLRWLSCACLLFIIAFVSLLVYFPHYMSNLIVTEYQRGERELFKSNLSQLNLLQQHILQSNVVTLKQESQTISPYFFNVPCLLDKLSVKHCSTGIDQLAIRLEMAYLLQRICVDHNVTPVEFAFWQKHFKARDQK